MLRLRLCALVCFALMAPVAQAQAQRQQRPEGAPPAAAQPAPAPAAATDQAGEQKAGATPAPPREAPEEKPSVTHHDIRAGGKTLRYTVTTGMMPMRDSQGKLEAHIFYMAYALDNPPEGRRRPLTFSFNGGPGSASVWLHMGAIGPRRVRMENEGWLPAPPYSLEDNPNTWLDQTDLVFIDPVGTGYSRAVSPDIAKKFWNTRGDIESVGEFIRLYLGRAQRWDSPLFVVGESYGTFRAAGLAGYLVDHGIAFNGVMLISTILNLNASRDEDAVQMLPSYTATAWYHKRLAPDLQQDLQRTLREAEAFAAGDYATALTKGARMTPAEHDAAVAKM